MASSVDASTRPERTRHTTASTTRDLLLALPFLALLYVQLAHHVMWRDELNALAIAWASPTIPSLFWHIHHEGHPWLWYMILWIPSRFTQSLLVLKVVQGIVSTAIILFVTLRSPFRTWEKALVLAGYFFVFEYTVLARMYGLMLLLFVVYLWWRTTRPSKPVVAAALLGLMSSTDNIGMILAGALIIEYAYTAYLQRKTVPLFSRRQALLAALTYAAIAGFAVWSAKPASDISWRTTGKPFAHATDMSHLYDAFLRYTVMPFFPVQSPRSHLFWNPTPHRAGLAYAGVVVVVLAMLYLSFRYRHGLLLMIGVTIVAGTALSHFIYAGSERHYGVVFLAFLAGAWIVRAESLSEHLAWPIYTLLAISALSSVWAVVGSWERPFSCDKATADWIVQNHLESMPLVGDQDTSVMGVAQYLHRSMYMIECSCEDTYLLYTTRRDNYKEAWEPRRVLEAAHYYHDEPILFVKVRKMQPEERQQLQTEGFQIEPLAEFTGAEELYENFYLYRLTLGHSPEHTSAGSAGTPTPTF